MTHLPYIAAAYTLGIGIPVVFAILSRQRLAATRRRLAAIDPRASRP